MEISLNSPRQRKDKVLLTPKLNSRMRASFEGPQEDWAVRQKPKNGAVYASTDFFTMNISSPISSPQPTSAWQDIWYTKLRWPNPVPQNVILSRR